MRIRKYILKVLEARIQRKIRVFLKLSAFLYQLLKEIIFNLTNIAKDFVKSWEKLETKK